jgi:hypothetical protein
LIGKEPVLIKVDPLQYHLVQRENRLVVQINNPTEERVVLLGDRSFVVDPRGESHPLRSRVIGPRSYTHLLLPPIPFAYPSAHYGWGWGGWGGWGGYGGWGWGAYSPFWGPYYGPVFYGPPAVTYTRVMTNYDWEWKTGPVRLRLSYESGGKNFDHDFEVQREKGS